MTMLTSPSAHTLVQISMINRGLSGLSTSSTHEMLEAAASTAGHAVLQQGF